MASPSVVTGDFPSSVWSPQGMGFQRTRWGSCAGFGALREAAWIQLPMSQSNYCSVSLIPYAPCMEYLPTKMGHF